MDAIGSRREAGNAIACRSGPQNWVAAPSSTAARDGLGPTFNAQSCSSCHAHDGRARPPSGVDDPVRGLLLRLSARGPDGPAADPTYGGQLQDRSIIGVEVEGRIGIEYEEISGAYPDGTTYSLRKPTYSILDPAFGPVPPDVMISPQIAPAIMGMGLLEAIPEDRIRELCDPDDLDGDGISGRPNEVWDIRRNELALGRFGWKSNEPTVARTVNVASEFYMSSFKLASRPVASMKPIASSHRKNAMPAIRCTMVAESTQMSCIANPMIADASATYHRVPPAVFFTCPALSWWYPAATISASPAPENPIFPVNHLRVLTGSSELSDAARTAVSLTSGASSASATAHAPETVVNRPDTTKSAGASGAPIRSRWMPRMRHREMIHVLSRSHAPAANAIPDTTLAAPPSP